MVEDPNGLGLKVKEEYIDDKIDIEEMEVYVNRYGTQSTTKAPKTSNAGIAPVLTQGKKKNTKLVAMSDKIKSLYDQLTDDGYDTGDLNTFSAKIRNKDKAQKLHEQLVADNYDAGDFDSFYSNIEPNSNSPLKPQGDKPYQKVFNEEGPSQKAYNQAKKMTIEDTSDALNQTTPGLTKYSLGAEINTLGMDYEMNKAFPKEGYQDSSRGKTYREETTWEKDNTVKKIDTIYQESDKKADEEAGGYLSYLGNIMNSLNTGASSAIAGVLGFGEEAYRDLADLNVPILTPLFEFSADVWKKASRLFQKRCRRITCQNS